MFDSLLHDLRYALRSSLRSPGFSAIVIVTMALAIGANTALFSVFNALVLRTLPVREPHRLVVLTATSQRVTGAQMIYKATLDALRGNQRVFSATALYSGGGALRVEARGTEIDGGIEGVEPAYFDMLGARPQLGRVLRSEDAIEPNGAPVVVISDRLWQRLFARDPNVVGQQIYVSATPVTVIGVTEPSFRGLQTDVGADLFMTTATLRPIAGDVRRPLRARNAIAQLRAGVSVAEARAAVQASWPSVRVADIPGLSPAERETIASQQLTVTSIATGFSPMRDQYAEALTVSTALTGLLLAVGCANLGGLLLSRAVARDQQTAIRLALGASRARLAQQLLVETVLLAALGTIAALPLAWWATRVLERALTAGSFLTPMLSMTPDLRVFVWSASIAVVTGALVALLPTWHSVRVRAALTEGARTTAPMPNGGRLLSVGQIALALVLLVAASLFARSMNHLRNGEARYDADRIVWTRLWMKASERRNATPLPPTYWTEFGERFSTLPGVSSIAFANNFPVFFAAGFGIERFELADAAHAASADALFDAISPGFFHTLGIPLLQWRDIAWSDTRDSTPIAIVTDAFARSLFPNGSAIGRRVRLVTRQTPLTFEIVGVVADAPYRRLDEPHQPALFRAFGQDNVSIQQPIMLVHTGRNVAPVVDAFRNMASTSGRYFVRDVVRLDQYVDEVHLRERLTVWLSSAFAGVAVLLSCIGIYALLAYSVARRAREIGIRIALGATPRAVLQAIAAEGLWLGMAGVAIGIPCALAGGRFVRSMLHGLAANDPLTIAGASIAFLAVSVVAGLLPAYRASNIDPMVALRQD
jgi:putative ABC transport system permease protein